MRIDEHCRTDHHPVRYSDGRRRKAQELGLGERLCAGHAAGAANFASYYLRQILVFIGIKDVEVVLAGRTLAPMTGEASIETFRAAHNPALEKAATLAA